MICADEVTVGSPKSAIDEELAVLQGERVLVVGNHEFAKHALDRKDYGCEAAYPTLVCESDPLLLLTQRTARRGAARAVNVHGQRHGAAREAGSSIHPLRGERRAHGLPAGAPVGAGHDRAHSRQSPRPRHPDYALVELK